jgi:Mor family transcriptional regulator
MWDSGKTQMKKQPQKWIPVSRYQGLYEVDLSNGQIRSVERTIIKKDGRKLHIESRVKIPYMSGRYPTVGLSTPGGKTERIAVHRVVLEAAYGPCPPGLQTRHLDDNPCNNNISNLRRGTQKQNSRDALRNGRLRIGEDHYNAKLTNFARQQIMDRLLAGESARSLSKEFGITERHIYRVFRKYRKKNHIEWPSGTKLSLTDKKKIIYLRSKGWTLIKIANKFGISFGRVWQICNGIYGV